MADRPIKEQLASRIQAAPELQPRKVQIVQHEVPGEVRRTAQYKEWIAKLQSEVHDHVKAIHISGDNVAGGDPIIPAHYELTRGEGQTEMESAACGHFNTDTLKYNLDAGLDGVEAGAQMAAPFGPLAELNKVREAMRAEGKPKPSYEKIFTELEEAIGMARERDNARYLHAAITRLDAEFPDQMGIVFDHLMDEDSGKSWDDYVQQVMDAPNPTDDAAASNGEESVPPADKTPYDGSRGAENAAKKKPKKKTDPAKPGDHEGTVALICPAPVGSHERYDTIQIGETVYDVLPQAWSGIQIGDEVCFTVAEPVEDASEGTRPLVTNIECKEAKETEPPKLDTEEKVKKQIQAFGELIISPENSSGGTSSSSSKAIAWVSPSVFEAFKSGKTGVLHALPRPAVAGSLPLYVGEPQSASTETSDAPRQIESAEDIAAFRKWVEQNAKRLAILSDEVDGTTTFFLFDLNARRPLGKAKLVAHYTHGSGVYDPSMKEGIPRSEFDDSVEGKPESELARPTVKELLQYIDDNAG